MGDISLLPEDLRGREQEIKSQAPVPAADGGLKMHVPDAMVDEDIEIIEVDEGDLAAVLSDEPFMTRLTYKISLLIDQLKGQLFKHPEDESAPPAKAPPHFFKPPKNGLVTSSQPTSMKPSVTITPNGGSPLAGGKASVPPAAVASPGAMMGSAAKARITPQSDVPRRVRVIKRVRKPVRVSLISAEDLAVLTIDVKKRKWTLGVFIVLFGIMIAGGYWLISSRVDISKQRLETIRGEVAGIRKEADGKLEKWKQYEDLEARMKLLQEALDQHVIITRLFDFLEENTLQSVTYKSMTWSGVGISEDSKNTGQVNLDVVSDIYDDINGQLVVIKRSPFVQKAETSDFNVVKDDESGEVTGITFQLALSLNKDMLKDGVGLEVDGGSSTSTVNSVEPRTSP